LLYIADSSLPIIHVLDVHDPRAMVEVAPLLATSLAQPTRTVQVGPIALSPPTRDYKRYLYAVDWPSAFVMVYDVTVPGALDTPLQRPHPELDPQTPIDRIAFGAPVAAMTFAQHDWPVLDTFVPTATQQQLAYTGLLCNPNQNAGG